MLDDQLPADLAAHLLRRDDCKVLFLWRRNLLQTVVSVLLAEQTRLYGARWRSVPERTCLARVIFRYVFKLTVLTAGRAYTGISEQAM